MIPTAKYRVGEREGERERGREGGRERTVLRRQGGTRGRGGWEVEKGGVEP